MFPITWRERRCEQFGVMSIWQKPDTRTFASRFGDAAIEHACDAESLLPRRPAPLMAPQQSFT
jgi:hypothetical protein